ncbi:ABC-2 transporter permease [Bacillus safensis]|uniref:ABC-2 transporter permease n=1 Tax=Bacillus safensis TaxID=561879 RepID=UPI0022803CDC|nr:ABC-2 transporter permease [Bacillus safensis]MCY7738451.1 ABC-2 transporter permease [Bacillus safensis]
MKGLILNDIYIIQKGIKTAIILSVLSILFLLLTKSEIVFKVAVLLPFLIIPVKSFEILKYDVKSGWDKFSFTLPVKRTNLVKAKYITFLILITLSFLLSFGLFFLIDLLFFPSLTFEYYNQLLRGLGLIICVGAMLYPLTYKLGIEKSDSITIYSLGFSFGVFFSLAFVAKLVLESNRIADMIFSVVFFGLSVFFLIISYLISCSLVKRKEF